MIDLKQALKQLNDAIELAEDLDGLDLTDPQQEAIASIGKDQLRRERAQASRDMLLLADTCAMAESLVRNAYWTYKGEMDQIQV